MNKGKSRFLFLASLSYVNLNFIWNITEKDMLFRKRISDKNISQKDVRVSVIYFFFKRDLAFYLYFQDSGVFVVEPAY